MLILSFKALPAQTKTCLHMQSKPDYQQLIDEEVWRFIERTNASYPANAVELSIEEQRKVYTLMCQAFHQPRPSSVNSVDDTVPLRKELDSTTSNSKDGNEDAVCNAHDFSHAAHASDVQIAVRRYTNTDQPNNAVHIVYLHGGGFVVGGLDSHDDVCAEICDTTQMGVTAVDYRLSPEHKHPAAFDDCLSVVMHEAERLGCKIILCGDSAGATLCAALSHYLRTANLTNPVKAQVLIYPALGTDTSTESCIYHADAPMLTQDEVKFYLAVRATGEIPSNDVSFAPLHDSDFTGLPNTLVLSAECDPLCSDGKLYCDAIEKAGGHAHWRCETGNLRSIVSS